MENLVNQSKYVSETISIIVSFAQVLANDETIQGIPTVTVALETGDDPSPSDILYLGASVHNRTNVEQRFRQGVPGVIYEITYQIITNFSHTFEQTVYLAILPNAGTAPPVFTYIYLTSQLYPLQTFDEYQVSFSSANGTFTIGQIFPSDLYQISFGVVDGTFSLAQLFYTTVPEQYKINFSVADGTFIVGQLFYTTVAEQYKLDFSPLDGTLIPGQVFYTSKTDQYQVSFLPLDGTFS